MNFYLNGILDFFPERLASEKWKDCCRFEGLEHLQSARDQGRPVILAFYHFGPYRLTRCLLRSHGIPVAALLGKPTGGPSRYLRGTQDKFELFPEVPVRFRGDQLREAHEFLAAGNILAMPIDGPAGKQMQVPFCEGWTFRMSVGAIRMAIHTGADLIPMCMVDEGRWRFSVILGAPVPREFLSGKENWVRAGKHLIDEMIPVFRAHPEQCRPDFVQCLSREKASAPRPLETAAR